MELYTVSTTPPLPLLKGSVTPRQTPSAASLLRPLATGSGPADDNEISIFDARRYFDENPDRRSGASFPPQPLNVVSSASRLSSVSSLDGCPRNIRSGRGSGSFNVTPTASSEASWNSQAGLLSNPHGSIPISFNHALVPASERRRRGCRPKRWILGRTCPCSGRKSVDVDEKSSESRKAGANGPHSNCKRRASEKPPPRAEAEMAVPVAEAKMKLAAATGGNWAKSSTEIGSRIMPSGRSIADTGFSFPILNQPLPGGKLALPSDGRAQEETPRESLEVFGLQFPGDCARRSYAFPASPRAWEDDLASDSSSDLFEIESLSTQGTAPWRRRESLEETARLPPRPQTPRSLDEGDCLRYEPSEASVEWSVATAEGLDGESSATNRSVAASDINGPAGFAGAVFRTRAGGGGLLSCRCEKAVSVGPHPVKCGPNPPIVGPTSTNVDAARIAAMSKMAGGNMVHVHQALLAESHAHNLLESSKPKLKPIS